MPPDYFATLGLERRAALNEDELKQAYLSESQTRHPDKDSEQEEASAEINKAYEVLGCPDKRLKHLLELERGDAGQPWRPVPMDADLMNLFEKLGRQLQAAAALDKRKQAAQSALARALLSADEMKLRENLEAIGLELGGAWESLENDLPRIDNIRSATPEGAQEEMRILQAKFAYLAKWRAQVREALLQMM